jgi:uncharacterized protein (TIGR03084 family)
MSDATGLVDDMVAEGEALDAIVAPLAEADWATPTPAPGWTIAHQVGHLAWTDRVALLSATDPDGFAAEVSAAGEDPFGFVDKAAEEEAARPPAELLADWRAGRARLAQALREHSGGKLPWFGPPMSVGSMATARLMETWAHGLDVADALGVAPARTARLRSVAHIGVRTRDFAYAVNGLTAPADPFRIELIGPDGELWTWGPDDAAQRVTGSAFDFCELVTQRRAPADLDVVATGPDAEKWLTIAQCFAGPPGEGRAPSGEKS